jgi:hypothetical protein
MTYETETLNTPELLIPRPRPCASCPYRKDVPSGVWSASEYGMLPDFDGTPAEQAVSERGTHLFCCHQADGHLCSGWVGHREHPAELLALRIGVANGQVAPETMDYHTEVPLFASGAEAAEHGKRDILDPSPEAVAVVQKIITVREANGTPLCTHNGDCRATSDHLPGCPEAS